jgi:hypothetical protein
MCPMATVKAGMGRLHMALASPLIDDWPRNQPGWLRWAKRKHMGRMRGMQARPELYFR